MASRLRLVRGALRIAAALLVLAALLLASDAGETLRRLGGVHGAAGLEALARAVLFLAAASAAAWGLIARRARPLRAGALLFGLGMGALATREAAAFAARPAVGAGDVAEILLATVLYVGVPVVALLLAAKTYEGAAPRTPPRARLADLVARGRRRYAALAEEERAGEDA